MPGINRVMLVGHLGKNPALRSLSSQVVTVSFPLATTEFILINGVRVEHTEWHYIVMWRGLANSAANILKKGMLVYIEGKCRTRAFEGKDGIQKNTTEIVAEFFSILGNSDSFELSADLKK